MRIHELNDIHLEFGGMDESYSPPECDVVVLAGDICPGLYGVDWAKENFTKPVVLVPGNHEFWGQKPIHEHVADMKSLAEGTNVHVLYNDTVVIDRVRFIGATMWTDFNLYGNAPIAMLTSATKDSEKILFAPGEAFSPQHMIAEHNYSRFYLMNELAKPFDGKTVVVTHHAPSSLSIHPRYERQTDLNPAYASRLEDIMLDYNPVLFCHGHMHDSFDYMIGDTRVICNPKGYKSYAENENFDPNLVIEV